MIGGQLHMVVIVDLQREVSEQIYYRAQWDKKFQVSLDNMQVAPILFTGWVSGVLLLSVQGMKSMQITAPVQTQEHIRTLSPAQRATLGPVQLVHT
jgi:hypothetical protein